MAAKTSDKDTTLDLMANMVPLAIILLPVVTFIFVNPFGFELLTSGFRYTFLIIPFILLVTLTYLSGKAIVGSGKGGTVCASGRAAVPGVKPLYEEESEGAAELEESPADDAVKVADETA